MRRNDRRRALLCALLVCALPCCQALAEPASPTAGPAAPTVSADPAASAAPTATGSPAPDGTSTPDASSTPDAAASPTPEASPDASASPLPSATPAASHTAEPSLTPSASPAPSPAPTVYPTLALGMEGEDVLKLQSRLIELGYMQLSDSEGGAGADGDASSGNGATGAPSAGDGATDGTPGEDGAAGGALPSGVYDEATQTAVMLFQARVGLEATGIADDATQQLLYSPDAPAYDPDMPLPSATPGGGFPGGGYPGGGFPSGSFPSGGGMLGGATGAADMAAQPTGVIPGVALTSSHSSGGRDMTLYGAVSSDALEALDGQTALQALELHGVALDIELRDDAGNALEFCAAYADGVLMLSAQQAGVWQVNGYALRTLALSGIDALRLDAPGASAELPTGEPLEGEIYARLRAQGLVSHDFAYLIGAQVTVEVDGQTYSTDMSGSGIALSAPEQG